MSQDKVLFGFYLLLSGADGQCGLEELVVSRNWAKKRKMKWSKFNEHMETTG